MALVLCSTRICIANLTGGTNELVDGESDRVVGEGEGEGVNGESVNNAAKRRRLEDDFGHFEEFTPTFLEPIVMTEIWNEDEEKTYVYHYPKTTAIFFTAFGEKFKIILKRRDAIFGEEISTSDFHDEEMDYHFAQGWF